MRGMRIEDYRFAPKSAPAQDDWISPEEFAKEYCVSRSTAYDAFKRLESKIKIGRCVRARRSEIEEKIAQCGRI